jgi:uncharacterized membrane protein YbjE (DUF340 family)
MYGIMLVSLIISGFIFGKTAHNFIKQNLLIKFQKSVSLCQNISIFGLLSMMGYKIGSNRELISGFRIIGIHSLFFGLAGLLGSALLTWVLVSIANKIHIKKRKKPLKSHVSFHVDEQKHSQLYNILIIAVFLGLVVLGGFSGYFSVLSIDGILLEKIIDFSLMALVFFIGIDMGLSQLNIEHIKSISLSAVLICTGVIIGSLSSSVLAGIALGYDWLFSLAVGSPMGWYSLGGIMLSKVSEELGAITFSANLLRELIAIATVPLVGTIMSKESAIAMCGATAMDTTLPTIAKGLGRQYAVTGFACGIVISSIVPIFLPIIQSIYGII